MKSLYIHVALMLISSVVLGQGSVPKVPVYEIFSSSTCPPCKPASDFMTPILENYAGELAVVKYQMDWPGTGDPYFTSEGASRKSYYAVNGVPSVFRNSTGVAYSQLTASAIDADLELTTSMKMELRYMIDEEAQTVRVRAYIEALEDYTDGAHRIMIPILENTTTQNVKTNGETEFHNVFKKMLPKAQGDIVIGTVTAGTVFEYDTTYAFQGDYRLPANAGFQIDHEIEHSVEEFVDLHVVMFMQSLSDKEIYQGAIGVKEELVENLERPWGTDRLPPLSVSDFNASQGFSLFPNPTSDLVNLVFADPSQVTRLRVLDVTGVEVHNANLSSVDQTTINTGDFANGLYLVEVVLAGKRYTKPLVVQH